MRLLKSIYTRIRDSGNHFVKNTLLSDDVRAAWRYLKDNGIIDWLTISGRG